jgi:hypothetical protein
VEAGAAGGISAASLTAEAPIGGVGAAGSAALETATSGVGCAVVLWDIGSRPVIAPTPTAEKTVTEIAAAVSSG